MGRAILVRAGQAVATLLILLSILFFAMRIGGDPVTVLLGPVAPQEQRDLVASSLGLDRPLIEQYTRFLTRTAQGDLGRSYRSGVAVRDLIIPRLGNSAMLAGAAVGTAALVSIPLGVVAAKRRNGLLDKVLLSGAALGQSVPHFWLGIMLILVLSVWLGVLPASGMGSWRHYVLPVVTLSAVLSAGLLRLTRAATIATLGSDYVKFLRVGGLREWRVTWIHALRNSISEPMTFAAMYLGLLAGGTVVIETIFAWPGLGRLTYEAFLARDFPLMQGAVAMIAVVVIGVNFAADLVHAALDPRIRR